MIQIENINVSYQQTLALDNITLNLEDLVLLELLDQMVLVNQL
mgnify:CR=1 FL=1